VNEHGGHARVEGGGFGQSRIGFAEVLGLKSEIVLAAGEPHV
jgi:hypothetical protein